MKKYKVTLTQEERQKLISITQKGKHRSQKVLNALILLNCDEGDYQDKPLKNKDVASVLKISMRKIDRVKKCFVEQGLDIALNGTKGQRAYERKADGDFEARLIALSCNEPPEGFSRWSLRLLADKVVELNMAEIELNVFKRPMLEQKDRQHINRDPRMPGLGKSPQSNESKN